MLHAAIQAAEPAPEPAAPVIWHNAPSALRLMALLIVAPPVRERCIRTYARTRDEWTRYAGEAVDQLRRFRHEAICAATGAEPDPAASADDLERWCLADQATLGVDDLIDRMLVVAGKTVAERVVRL